MSILTDLFLLKFANQLKPSRLITILGVIYLIFICRSSWIAEGCIALIGILIILLCFWANVENKRRDAKASWKDSPLVKARVREWEERNSLQSKKKENPYE